MKNKNFKVLTCLILLCIIFINSFLQCFAFDKENSNNVDLFVSKANNNIIIQIQNQLQTKSVRQHLLL